MIIEVDDKLIAADIFSEKFVCDLAACKGACCVEGDAGAPVTTAEINLLEELFDKIKPFLTKEGIKAIEKKGVFYFDKDGDAVTTLVDNSACAFATFDPDGTAKCGIEQANNAGVIEFKKPISCALFPIRTKKFERFEALNYESIPICKPACECGSKLNVPVYRFLKEPLVRAYGKDFYEQLEVVAEEINKTDE